MGVFFEWFWLELKMDIKDTFKMLISLETYKSMVRRIKIFLSEIGGTYTKPKNKVYIFFILWIVSLYIFKLFIVKLTAFLLFLLFYFLKLWRGGEPLKFYKERYYGVKRG